MPFVLDSPAFADGHEMPRRFARDDDNLSPPLTWKDAPPETRSFALIVEDPDAPDGTFRHWALYDIPAGETQLAEGGRTERAGGGLLGSAVNDFGNLGYDGPQPPRGHGPHRYHFRLAALDVDQLDPPPDAKAADIWEMAQRHVIAEAEMVGIYERR